MKTVGRVAHVRYLLLREGGARNYGSTEPRKAEYYVLRSFSKRRGQKDKETINNEIRVSWFAATSLVSGRFTPETVLYQDISS